MSCLSQCPNCLFVNSSGALECPRCNTSLEVNTEYEEPSPQVIKATAASKESSPEVLLQCPTCLFINTRHDRFCPVCGGELLVNEDTNVELGETKRKINEGYRSQCPKCHYINTYGKAECPRCGESLFDESLKYEYEPGLVLPGIDRYAYESTKYRYIGLIANLILAIMTLYMSCLVESCFGYEGSFAVSIAAVILFALAAILVLSTLAKFSLILTFFGSIILVADMIFLEFMDEPMFAGGLNLGLILMPLLLMDALSVTYHETENASYKFALNNNPHRPRIGYYVAVLLVYFGVYVFGIAYNDSGTIWEQAEAEVRKMFPLALFTVLAYYSGIACVLNLNRVHIVEMMGLGGLLLIVTFVTSSLPAMFIFAYPVFVLVVWIGGRSWLSKGEQTRKRLEKDISVLESLKKPVPEYDRGNEKKIARIEEHNAKLERDIQAVKEKLRQVSESDVTIGVVEDDDNKKVASVESEDTDTETATSFEDQGVSSEPVQQSQRELKVKVKPEKKKRKDANRPVKTAEDQKDSSDIGAETKSHGSEEPTKKELKQQAKLDKKREKKERKTKKSEKSEDEENQQEL